MRPASESIRRTAAIFTLSIAAVALAQPPASRPATLEAEPAPVEAPTVEQLRGMLSDPAPEPRDRAIEGLLAAGRAGRQALAVEAARLIRQNRQRLVPRAKLVPRDAQAALDAHAAWAESVKGTLRLIRATTVNDRKQTEAMMKSVRKTLAAYDAFRSALTVARRRQAPLRAGLAQLNQYEHARARAEKGYRPHDHKLHELAAAAGARYPVAFEKVLAAYQRMDAIEKVLGERNARHKDKLDAQEYRCLILLNSYRRKMGVVPLAWNAKLYEASRQHSKEMQELSYFSHRSPVAAYRTFSRRAATAGYTGYRNLGENIALTRGAESAHHLWQISPSHHLQMLDPTHREVAIGRTGRYWTQMFGTRGRNPWDGSKAPPPDYLWVHRK